MPKLTFNLDEIQDYTPIPAGRYKARLIACTQKTSKASGQPMLEWEWKLISGKKDVKGRTARSWTSLQSHALAALKEHLLAFGLKGKVRKSTDNLIGSVVTLVFVETESRREGFEGEPDSRIARVLHKSAFDEDTDDDFADDDLEEDSDSDEDDDFDDEDEDDLEDEEEYDEEDFGQDDEDDDFDDDDDEPVAKPKSKRRRKVRK